MTDYATARRAMVDCQIRPSDVTKFTVIDAMGRVPREKYVPDDARRVAYAGDHIEIADGRVVLDPRVLAKMLDYLDIRSDELVLDIGCGLGYSTAVIACMSEAVVGVESDTGLADDAEATLAAQGVDNAIVARGPLDEGAAKHGPYDVVIIEGGIEQLPPTLESQIKDGGRICAIFIDGTRGQCRVGVRGGDTIAWRYAFDSKAPVIAAFNAAQAFVF